MGWGYEETVEKEIIQRGGHCVDHLVSLSFIDIAGMVRSKTQKIEELGVSIHSLANPEDATQKK